MDACHAVLEILICLFFDFFLVCVIKFILS